MKINGTSNNSFQNKVLLDTFVEQISALQEDVAQLQDADRVLDNKISQQLSEEEFSNFQADAHVSNLHAAEINADTGFIGHLSSTQVDAENASLTNAEVQNLTALNANIPSLTTDDVTVQGDITSAGDITAKDAVLDNVSANKVETPLVEADLVKADVLAEDVETDTATVKDKLTVKDVEVSGTVTGLSEVNADSVNANEAEIETINTEHIRSWISQVMNQEEALLPTPALSDIDRYTIELPKFNGVYLLSWEDQDIVWSATVIGNGKSYGISWSSRTDENFITDLFQYNGKLYIRVRSNGRLKFAYSATKELPQPVIYFNMVGWTSDKSLEELCDEKSHLINSYPVGMIWFGKVFIPKLETAEGTGGNGINFKGSCTLAQLPAFDDTEVGDVWNITNETYTDDRFIEGAGKPVNAGDDVVAVEDATIGNGVKFRNKTELYDEYTVRTDDSQSTGIDYHDYIECRNGNRYLYNLGYTSVNGSSTWIKAIESAYVNPNTIRLFSNDAIFYVSGHAGSISLDGGLTWKYAETDFEGYVAELPNGHLIAALYNYVFDAGTNTNVYWGDTITNFTENSSIYAVDMTRLANGILVIKTNTADKYISNDDGQTWYINNSYPDSVFDRPYLKKLHEDEITARTYWEVQSLQKGPKDYYIERWMDWYGGRSYYKTTNFETFTTIESGSEPYMSFCKDTDGNWYGLSSSYIWKSTDNGLTWTWIDNRQCRLFFIDSNNTFWRVDYVGNYPVYKSTDGGNTWTRVDALQGSSYVSFNGMWEMPNGNLIIYSPGWGGINYISTNHGETWTRTSEELIDIKVTPSGKAIGIEYVNDSETKVYESLDNGLTWTEIRTVPKANQISIDNDGYIYVGNVMSKNDGVTWDELDNNLDLNQILLGDDGLIYGIEGHTLYQSIPAITKTLKWDKFAAGVNYDNFAAANITATSIKKNNSNVLTEADRTNTVTENSTDVLTSGGAYTALATKQDNLTFDNIPTENSSNPVKSGGVYSALNTKIDNSEKGIANGVATLDSTGRVPYDQLPESAMEYKGTWDASTNTPALVDGTGTNGDFYVVSVGGTVTFSAGRSITFYVNDRVIYDGTLHEWERLPAGEVRSVNGQTGDVTLSIPTVVDIVADGNMNAVTSNAVYDYIDAAITQVLNTGF